MGAHRRDPGAALTYRWVEHTGELELEIEADSEPGVFAAGLEAMRELLADEEAPPYEPAERAVTVAAADRPQLLAAWLGELAFLAETEGLVPERATGLHVGGGTVSATVHGRRAEPRHLVKAVTYHRLAFEPRDGRWLGHAVLDV